MKKKLVALLASAALLASGVAWAAGGGPAPGVNSTVNPVWTLPNDSPKYTYAVGFELSPLSAQQDLFQLCGAANTITRVTRISLNGRATAVSPMPVFLFKRSSGTTGGQYAPQSPFLSATVHGTSYDTGNSTSTATASAWQTQAVVGGPQTLGTSVGLLAAGMLYLGNLTTGANSSAPLVWEFGTRPSQDVVLRSASQCIAINLSAGTYAGNLIDGQVEWTEE